MSTHTVPTLLQLAIQAVLRQDALDVSDLEYLPRELFPPLFKEAFTGRHTKILKPMVAAWPLPCLPVGALMKVPNVETLQAVLDGIDILLTQRVHPRRCRLRELNLRNVHQLFWDVWAGTEPVTEQDVAKGLPRYGRRRLMKVLTDLSLSFHLKEPQMCLLQWTQQRRGIVKLCCQKMKICAFPVGMIKEVLDIFQPDYVEELELSTSQVLTFLGHFAPCLGQMRNLCKLRLTHVHLNTDESVETLADREGCAAEFLSAFSKLNCLQHLSMNGIYFTADLMKRLLRCLNTPLESLSITLCQLSEADLKHLSTCPRLCDLKHLVLNGVALDTLHTAYLGQLLEAVADTLQTLELEHCRMRDSQLSALLPALSQCSRLTRVNFFDNDISTAVLKELLGNMAGLPKLSVELYPAPRECFDDLGNVLMERFVQLCTELLDTLRANRQPKAISVATGICFECGQRCVYDMKTRLCHCWQ